MTKKIYKTAQGKTLDMGALILQNENIRAVGNMNVNARGDLLDSTNQTIDKKNRQVQRQYQQASAPASESHPIKRTAVTKVDATSKSEDEVVLETVMQQPPPVEQPQTGLAAAMARTRTNKKSQ